MKNVKWIIELLGDFERLKQEPIQRKVEGFLPLNIEYVGKGPRAGMLLSVMHHYLQHGDVMKDPDLVVEVFLPVDEWLPVSYQRRRSRRNDASTELGLGQHLRSSPSTIA
jgi:hypothetical protein